jgi:hypothetical protein
VSGSSAEVATGAPPRQPDREPPASRWPEIAAVAAACASGVLLGWLTGVKWVPTLPDRLTLVRIALAITLALGLAVAVRRLRDRAAERLRREWWDPTDGPPDAPLTWNEVHTLVTSEPDADPLLFVRSKRERRWAREWSPVILCIAALSLAGGQALLFLWDPTAWPAALTGRVEDGVFRDVVSASGNLTAYLALLASGITIVFTYGQLQARVRADSRQEWIVKARGLLAETLAASEAHRSAAPWSRVAARREMDRRRLELELMLNPSEKDHRLLLYLVQRHALAGLAGEDDIQDATSVRHSIAVSGSRPPITARIEHDQPDGESRPDLGPAWNGILYANRRADLLAFVLRLAHVVLKREWERVKHTR